MNLFSRDEQILKPRVSIQLHQSTPLRPGAHIAGTITLLIHGEDPRQVCSASAVCIGNATTHNIRSVRGAANVSRPSHNRKTIHYHDHVQLFQLEQSLLGDTQVVSDESVSLPFSFILPGATVDNVESVPYTSTRTTIDAYPTSSHALPPTFSHVKTDHHYASVEYGLQLVVHFGDDCEPYISPVQPLLICPPASANLTACQESIRPKEEYSSSRLVGVEKSVMNSFRDKLSKQTPSVEMTLKAMIPEAISTGGAFSIQTCVEIDSLSAPNISIPSVEVRITSLKLRSITFSRALRVSGNFTDRDEHEEIDGEKLLLNANPSTRMVEAESAEKGSKLVFPAIFEGRIPADTCPSFRTFNINRTYRLKGAVEADVCGKAFEHKFEMNIVIDAPPG